MVGCGFILCPIRVPDRWDSTHARGSPEYFKGFYRRRFFRIFPLYFAFLGVLALLSKEAEIPWQFSTTFLQNIWMAVHNKLGSNAVNITWSLSVEEQFYLMLPLIVYFLHGRRLLRVLMGGIVAAPLVRLGIYLLNPKLNVAIYVLLPCRMDSLLLGVVVAYFVRQAGALEWLRSNRKKLWTGIEILSVACGSLLFLKESATLLIGYSLFGLLYSCILMATLVDEVFIKVLTAKWLMGLGSTAYCVYLFHQLIYVLMFNFMGQQNWPFVPFIAMAVTMLVATISWKYFEKPCLLLARSTLIPAQLKVEGDHA